VEVRHGGKRANIAILSRNGKAANCGRALLVNSGI
jgi:hypothetical protein